MTNEELNTLVLSCSFSSERQPELLQHLQQHWQSSSFGNCVSGPRFRRGKEKQNGSGRLAIKNERCYNNFKLE